MKKHHSYYRYAKQLFLLLLCILFSAGISFASETNTDYFIGDTGMIRYQPYPHAVHLPWTESELAAREPDHDWSGIFYGPGYGMEISIWYNQYSDGTQIAFTIKDYAYYEKIFLDFVAVEKDANTLTDTSGLLTIRRLSQDEIALDVSPQWYDTYQHKFYREGNTFVMTRVQKLLQQSYQENWKGTYEHWNDASDYYSYITAVPLYNTGDYVLITQVEQYGQPSDFSNSLFVVDYEGTLIHEYPPSEVFPYTTYHCMTKGEHNSLQGYECPLDQETLAHIEDYPTMEDYLYIRSGSKTMWKENDYVPTTTPDVPETEASDQEYSGPMFGTGRALN